MRIALATCRDLPDWEIDDAPLHAALKARGVELDHPAWDDPEYDWSACDACLIRTTWDYTERRAAFVDWAQRAGRVTRLFNPPAVVRWNTHKTYLHDLECRGAPVVPTVWLQPAQRVDLAALMAERGWSRGFLKPVVGATARETLRFDADSSGLAVAQRHLDRLLAREAMMLQPYLARVERDGEISVIFIDGHISHVVRKIPQPGDYRVQDDFGARDEPWHLPPAERRIAEAIAEGLDNDALYARVDFLRDDNGRLCCNELEAVEPSLFFRHAPQAAHHLASALLARL